MLNQYYFRKLNMNLIISCAYMASEDKEKTLYSTLHPVVGENINLPD